jgi:very-short-patch-repair endonuclease
MDKKTELQKAAARAERDRLEELFAFHLRSAGLADGFLLQYHFHPNRQWRFDFAHVTLKLAVEIEGGHWTGGRHVRPLGFQEDCRKYNAAALLGWTVLRFTANMLESGEAILAVEQWLKQNGALTLID